MKMKKRLLARIQVLFLLLFIFSAGFAQTRVITGKVTSASDGTPLGGVSVVAKGTSTGTTTGTDGTFKIQVGPGVKTLVFSSVSFGSYEATISGQTVFASLTPTNSNLNDIVVIGYGTAKKKDLTGSIDGRSRRVF